MRAIILIVLALILFFCDQRFHCFANLRSQFVFITSPIQYIVNCPLKLVSYIIDNLSSRQIMLNENKRFRDELQFSNVRQQRLEFLEHENSELRILFQMSQQIKSKLEVAQLLISAIDSSTQYLTINKGKQHGVYVGQPVVDAYGLLGQVISVVNAESRILLLTNSKSAVPVIVTRNGLHAIAVGAGYNDRLELLNVPETADIKIGDSLVTSGLEQRFPAGYQVGVVKEIKHEAGERFMKVIAVPSAHLDNGLQVVLIWPNLPRETNR